MRTSRLALAAITIIASACSDSLAPNHELLATAAPSLARARTIDTVIVTPSAASVPVGGTVQLAATAQDARGKTVGGVKFAWASSNGAVASVSSTGLVTGVAAGSATVTAASGAESGSSAITVTSTTAPAPDDSPTTAAPDTIFADGFESGSLSLWQDGVDPSRHRVLTDAALARSGSRLLEIIYPANSTGGWLTRFFMPGYDSVYVRYYVRFASDWESGTKLISLRGSRIDNMWSAFGVAGTCPNGTDFFSASLVTEGGATPPGPTRFYAYYVGMTREPDGVTCWGRYGGQGVTGQGTTSYYEPLTMSRGQWHMVEFWVRLNTPGSTNSVQRMWVDGALKGEWTGISFRSTTDLRLNSVMIDASLSGGAVAKERRLYVDDLVVLKAVPSKR